MKVAIIGAGPSGCLLARLLINANILVTVFDANPEPRPDGGTLDLHTDTGLAALKAAGLYEKFTRLARYDGESMQLVDKRCVAVLDMPGASKESSRGRPEIDRPRLVHMLVDSLPPGVIKFGHKLRHIDDSLTLHFQDSTESGFDLIVGADGAWSKSRRFLSDVQPYYTGISGYETSIPDADTNAPELTKLVRRGSVFGFDDMKALMVQQMGDGSLKAATWFVQSEPKGVAGDDAAALVRDKYQGWSPRLLEAVEHAKAKGLMYRPLYMLPIGFRWVHRPGVTLIGDAAHLMTPFAGEGVNVALQDSMKLAEHIIAASRDDGMDKAAALSRRVKTAEDDMFARAHLFTSHTWKMATPIFFEPGMPWQSAEKYVLTAASDEIPTWAWPLAVVVARVYFFVIRLLRAPRRET